MITKFQKLSHCRYKFSFQYKAQVLCLSEIYLVLYFQEKILIVSRRLRDNKIPVSFVQPTV